MSRRFRNFALLVLVLLAFIQRADASFHLILIVEVYPGAHAFPDAQYVMLQTVAINENFLSGFAIHTFNPDGTPGPDFGVFTTNPTNTASGARYLMATPQAATLFGLTPDGVATGRLPFPSGRICWASYAFGCGGSYVDCVAYGAYTGSNTGFGTPATALVRQRALVRTNAGAGSFVCPRDNSINYAIGAPNPTSSASRPFVSSDSDGDGIPNVSDCRPSDPGVWLLLETRNLAVSRGSGPSGPVTSVTWDDQSLTGGGSPTYDLAAGDLPLTAASGFTGAACLASNLSVPAFDDPDPDPALGSGRYYLSRGSNACGDGTYGNGFGPSPDPRDFLDDPATTPCP